MKSKAIKSYNLPIDRIVDFKVDAKPYFLIIFSTIVGVIFSMSSNLQITGYAITAIGFFAIIFLPNRILLEFSTDYVVIYNKANHNDCVMIYYNEIVNWSYIKKVYNDELCFELEDGHTEVVECFDPHRIERILNMYAPNKKKKNKKK